MDYLLTRKTNGRYDFQVTSGDLTMTDDSSSAILRLLIQGPWIGDDGERSGDSLQDVRFIDSGTKGRVQEICERRLSVLVRSGKLSSVDVISVQTEEDRIWAHISVSRPGKVPIHVQLPLGR